MDKRLFQYSTGPRTAAGKARAADNGRSRQAGPVSARQRRTELASLLDLVREMRESRMLTCQAMGGGLVR